MTAKKRKLGRGLDALLGGSTRFDDAQAVSTVSRPDADENVRYLPVDLIERGQHQPRRIFNQEALAELADSIRAQGVIQPVVVRAIREGHYELIAGERRWRAAQQAGLSDIPVVIREIDDRTAMAMALIENIQREDLNALEEADALHRLLNEYGLTHQQIAETVGKSRTVVTNLLRLLELESGVKALLEEGRLEMGHARALLALKGEEQLAAAKNVVSNALTVRQTEKLVKQLREPARPPASKRIDPDIRRLQERLGETMGARVQIQQNSRGKGKLVISYNSLDELDGILDHIN
ncbi:MAG: ParB/RepB/Spo0J family partition protein [gamma proteobacterium symbiont of Bathyaustriella thionipta]|nr:ParB/RepB/Spo0J family partition protein [gamma proteobacterium symbiont of Bathyaustriella thionipta]